MFKIPAFPFLRSLFRQERGNAALLVALGAPMLIGGAGLAVDTAQWYLWKRELQHSVDQSAISAAWALADTESAAFYKLRAEQEFEDNLSITRSFAKLEDGSPKLADYASGTANSVIVSAQATKSLPFSSLVMKGGVKIRVLAQASFEEGFQHNACLVALSKDKGVLDIGGNATVKAQCGLAALSCEDGAIEIGGSATVTTDSIATCGTVAHSDGSLDGVISEGVQGLEDIYKHLSPPDNKTARSYSCTGKGKSASANLQPGTYKGLVIQCTTTLSSGIYVIDGGELDLAANYNVVGNNVMFVLKNGAKIKFGGSGNGNSINLTPMVASDFVGTPYEAQADDLEGILVFEHRDNNPPNPGHILNGNSNSIIEGLIYLPSGTMTVLGTADVASQCLQISANKLKISGNAKLETLCPPEKTSSVGKSVAQVRLVA